MRRRPFRRSTGEPAIALINVVFLMTVFFLVAETLARPVPTDLRLVRTDRLDPEAPPDALLLHADGRLTWRGEPATAERLSRPQATQRVCFRTARRERSKCWTRSQGSRWPVRAGS